MSLLKITSLKAGDQSAQTPREILALFVRASQREDETWAITFTASDTVRDERVERKIHVVKHEGVLHLQID